MIGPLVTRTLRPCSKVLTDMRVNTAFFPFVIALGLAGCNNESNNAQNEAETAHAGPAINFHRIDPTLATGGHIVGNGVSKLVEQGVTLVIDLRDQPPEAHEKQLEDAGIQWVNVPVVWKEPTRDNFLEFSRVMSEHKDENILVQCQANYRASAMTYLYRVTKDGVPEDEARKDLNAVWTPEGTWQEYIDDILESSH